MTQQDVYDVLKRKPTTWLTAEEIKDEIGINKPTVIKSLNKLFNSDKSIMRRFTLDRAGATGMEFMYAKEFDEE